MAYTILKQNGVQKLKNRKTYYEIYINNLDKPFLLDKEDIKLLKGKITYNGNYILVGSNLLHRLVKNGPIIHHQNRNKLDNRKKNLIICNSKEEHVNFHFKKGKLPIWKISNLTDEDIDILSKLEEEDIYSVKKLNELNKYY